MIATAIGKPRTRATAIVDVNAESKFTPSCTLPGSDMAPLHGWEGGKPSTAETASRRTLDSRRDERMCSDMVNEMLTALDGR